MIDKPARTNTPNKSSAVLVYRLILTFKMRKERRDKYENSKKHAKLNLRKDMAIRRRLEH